MTLEALVAAVPEFDRLPHSEKIKYFGWFLHTAAGKQHFSTADIRKCYDEIRLERSGSTSAYIRVLTSKSPKEVLETREGYCLARHIKERFDKTYGTRPATVEVLKLLSDLPSRIDNLDERDFLNEALRCFRYQAFRSSIVMTWNLAYSHLCRWIIVHHLPEFNAQLPRSYPRSRISSISRDEDFSELKEAEVIQVTRSANLITSDLYKILNEKLGRRNTAAHPSCVTVTQLQAEDFITDLVNNVVLKLL